MGDAAGGARLSLCHAATGAHRCEQLLRQPREIPTLFNSVAQLKGQRAANATARFLFNSILGVGGLWDPATRMGLVRQSEDFGQTLGYWGVPQGPT